MQKNDDAERLTNLTNMEVIGILSSLGAEFNRYARVRKENDIKTMEKENEEAIERVIRELDLKPSEDDLDQLRIALKLHVYMVKHNKYDEEIMQKKLFYGPTELRTFELHNAVVKNAGVCSSNAIEFQSILSRLGLTVLCVAVMSKKDGLVHMANLVLIGDKYYYFDVTNDRILYEVAEEENYEWIPCLAGLGSKKYSELYQADAIIPEDLFDKVIEIPSNISEESIPQELIVALLKEDPGKKLRKQ